MKVLVGVRVVCEWLKKYEGVMPARGLLSILSNTMLIITIAVSFKNTASLYVNLRLQLRMFSTLPRPPVFRCASMSFFCLGYLG